MNRANLQAQLERAEAERRTQDLRRMHARDDWPRWPWLPLKRRVEGPNSPELAVLYASEPFQLLRTDLFELPKTEEQFKALKPEVVTPEQLIEDGWRVD